MDTKSGKAYYIELGPTLEELSDAFNRSFAVPITITDKEPNKLKFPQDFAKLEIYLQSLELVDEGLKTFKIEGSFRNGLSSGKFKGRYSAHFRKGQIDLC